jgi:hypothetical protein
MPLAVSFLHGSNPSVREGMHLTAPELAKVSYRNTVVCFPPRERLRVQQECCFCDGYCCAPGVIGN